MIRKKLYIVVPLIIIIFIVSGLLISSYLNGVRFYKPIRFILPEKSGGIENFRSFGIKPRGRVLLSESWKVKNVSIKKIKYINCFHG